MVTVKRTKNGKAINSTARSRAIRKLASMYKSDYSFYYQKARDEIGRIPRRQDTTSQYKAYSRLALIYPEKYRELYLDEKIKLLQEVE